MSPSSITVSNPPTPLKAKVEEYAERAQALGWSTETFFDLSTNGYMFGYVVARQPKSLHVSESVFLCWSWTTNARYRNQLRFANAWRCLTRLRTAEEGGDWRENSVGSEMKFHRIQEAVDFLKQQSPTRYNRNNASRRNSGKSAIITASNSNNEKETNEMATTSATKSASTAKKAPAKKAAAATKAAAAPPVTKSAERKAAAAAHQKEREAEKEAQRKLVVKLREQGKSWTDISSELSMDMNLANLRFLEATEYATPSNPTPKALRDAREKEKLSWIQIMAKFRYNTKPAAQRAYVEAGGDLSLQVGRGGRFIPHAEKPAASTTKSAAKSASSTKKASSAPVKSVFNGDEPAPKITEAIKGKTITVKSATGNGKNRTFKMDVFKVGKDRSGTRIVRFSVDGASHDVRIEDIVKVSR